jgi:hypothetical protein
MNVGRSATPQTYSAHKIGRYIIATMGTARRIPTAADTTYAKMGGDIFFLKSEKIKNQKNQKSKKMADQPPKKRARTEEKETAKEYVYIVSRTDVEMIIERFNCGADEELAEKYEKSRSEQDDDIEYDEEAIMKDLDSLTETVFAGEFVNVECDWSLVKQEVQD